MLHTSKTDDLPKEATSSSPAAEEPKLTKKYVTKALLETAEIALGRRPVKVAQIDNKTGKIVTFERLERDGVVATRSLELLGRALGLFDGRQFEDDDKPIRNLSDEEMVAYARKMVADWDAEHGTPPAAGRTAGTDRQAQEQHPPHVVSEAQLKANQQKKPAHSSQGHRADTENLPGHFPHRY